MSPVRKIGIAVAIVLVAILFGTCAAMELLGADKPRGGVSGSEADAIAKRMQAAVDIDAWQRTGAVTWGFLGRNEHLWDRQRKLARVKSEDRVVLIDLTTRKGKAWKGGQPVTGDELTAALAYAWASWSNDSFWLNPLPSLFDEGVTREKVVAPDDDGATALLVSYASGGLMAGDSYLWIVDAQGLPSAWRMWSAVFPVEGIRMSWSGWITLETGARVATEHAFPGMTMVLSGVRGAATLQALVGDEDPFAPIVTAP